ncbi:MAG TPA: CocE/NonD family hydrolase [Aeromicrobium sp.]|nr:CocE/NonD family hydrolase [Aeromicrobium sp.]
MLKRVRAAAFGVALIVPILAASPASAEDAAPVVVQQRVAASDGVELQTTLTSAGPVEAKPTVVEFSPYGRNSQTLTVGPDYNFLLVQVRGTGDSDGSFDALGPKSQADVVSVLQWACAQPWSNGDLALNGFSASAIVLYNSWHTKLPCVRAAILKSGTHELYRDLLVPGGIVNLLPGIGVLGLIGVPAVLQGGDRVARDPATVLPAVQGMFASGISGGFAHQTLDGWWKERGWRGDANDIPVLMIDGWFDVESRGAFQAYQSLRDDGAHLVVTGGHDGTPKGSDGGVAEATAWLDHHVRGLDNGVENHPRVRMLLAEGSRSSYLGGAFTERTAGDWPVPDTSWAALNLSAAKSGTSGSLNDGSLTLSAPASSSTQSYVTVPSLPTMSDVPNYALVAAAGAEALTGSLPFVNETGLAAIAGLGYTSKPLAADVVAAGPLNLDVTLSSLLPDTGIWAVLSDVAPNGSSHPLTVGRLSTSYPGVIASRSLSSDGRIVQPYGDYSAKQPAKSSAFRRYQVELWPVGNVFKAGHRIRLTLLGTSAASMPALPSVHTVRLGGATGAKLQFPVLPGSDLTAALQ